MARMGSERQLWLSILPAVDGTAQNSRGDRAADMPNLSQPRGKRPQSAPRRRLWSFATAFRCRWHFVRAGGAPFDRQGRARRAQGACWHIGGG